MDDHDTPGLANQSTVRTAARVASVVLVLVGVVLGLAAVGVESDARFCDSCGQSVA